MLKQSLIIALAGFAAGFLVGAYWQSTLRALDAVEVAAGDAKAHVEAWQRNAGLADTIHAIESNALKEASHASDDINRLSYDLAAGAVRLQLNAHCPGVPELTAGASMADGAGAGPASAPGPHRDAAAAPELSRAAEPAYLALRAGIQRCRTKVTALQGILEGERNGSGVGSIK